MSERGLVSTSYTLHIIDQLQPLVPGPCLSQPLTPPYQCQSDSSLAGTFLIHCPTNILPSHDS